jgi:hypothetical protein
MQVFDALAHEPGAVSARLFRPVTRLTVVAFVEDIEWDEAFFVTRSRDERRVVV